VKFLSVVYIQIFSLKNVNPSFYAKRAKNGYFLLPSKFEMMFHFYKLQSTQTMVLLYTLYIYSSFVKSIVFGSILYVKCSGQIVNTF
jgi:hypothetical protein